MALLLPRLERVRSRYRLYVDVERRCRTACVESGLPLLFLDYYGSTGNVAIVVEEAVRRITSMPAEIFGLADRGRLAPGLAADLVVFDPGTISDHPPELVHDLPDGGPRLVQRASGLVWSFVNGRAVIQEGRLPDPPDGPGPGRVLHPA